MKLERWVVAISFLVMLGAILGLAINIYLHGELGYTMVETGPVYLQIIQYCTVTSLMIFFANLAAWAFLKKKYKIPFLWILVGIAGTLIGEILSGLVLWEIGINRAELGLLQGGAIIPEVLIFLFSGALIGLFQYPFMRKSFKKPGYWIIACCVGWGLVPVTFYIFGGIGYGLITGAAITRLMESKDLIP